MSFDLSSMERGDLCHNWWFFLFLFISYIPLFAPHFTIGVDIRSGYHGVYFEVIAAEIFIQTQHLISETKIERSVKQAFDARGSRH